MSDRLKYNLAFLIASYRRQHRVYYSQNNPKYKYMNLVLGILISQWPGGWETGWKDCATIIEKEGFDVR